MNGHGQTPASGNVLVAFSLFHAFFALIYSVLLFYFSELFFLFLINELPPCHNQSTVLTQSVMHL